MSFVSILPVQQAFWQIEGTETAITGIYPTERPISGEENPVTRQAALELHEYLDGKRTSFSVPLHLSGTPFQKSVWEALQTIPYGQVRSYSQIAEQIGRPTAVRAVAQAIGRNPCLVLVPCHRVLGKDGSLTGFSAGLQWKVFLLQIEGR